MGEYRKIDYTQVALPEELLTSFAKAMLPELRKFYASDDGKAYFARWLLKHPEYAAHSTPESVSRMENCSVTVSAISQ